MMGLVLYGKDGLNKFQTVFSAGYRLQSLAEVRDEAGLRKRNDGQQRAPVIELVAVAHVAAFAGDAAVIFVNVAMLGPFLQEDRGGSGEKRQKSRGYPSSGCQQDKTRGTDRGSGTGWLCISG